MNFRPNYLFVFLSVLLFCGCTQTEDAPWNNETVAVVYSLISPNNQVQVYLGTTYQTGDSALLKTISKARVFICGADSVWLELYRLADTSSVFVDSDKSFPIGLGKTYYLKVELTDRTLHAQTTVPNEAGKIMLAKCLIPHVDNHSAGIQIDGKSYDAHVGTLDAKFSLPVSKSVGCYLSAFGQEIGDAPYLTTATIQDQEFYLPKEFSTFPLNLITVDANFKKFRIAQNIDEMQSSTDVSAIIGSYSGVRPVFSNIQNGIGLFGSFVVDSLIVHADIQPE